MTPRERLNRLAAAARTELTDHILPFWLTTQDRAGGGYYGLVTNQGTVDPFAPKGVVMHARHLWASSTAWMERRLEVDRLAADHAFAFLAGALRDREQGGFWWTVDAGGRPDRETKVLYGQAFAVYGLAQYARATGNAEALTLALDTFALLEKTGRDREAGGYYEAVDRGWTTALIHPLSDTDIACAKSMNTNLHVLEAYSSLFLATGRADVREALASLLGVFERHILVTPEHLGLYFDRNWNNLTDHVSYGHDIEASWLMTEAAHLLGEPDRAPRYLPIARKTRGLLEAHGGSLPNETHAGHLDTDRIWWVQAEALVGMVNAFEVSGDEAYLSAAEGLWDHIDRVQADRQGGDWFWLVDASGKPDLSRPKGGLWKTSYHNGRACLEVMLRARRET